MDKKILRRLSLRLNHKELRLVEQAVQIKQATNPKETTATFAANAVVKEAKQTIERGK